MTKPSTKKAVKKPAAKKPAKRKPNAAFLKPVQPDAKLAAVVGSKPLPRTELTKKLWDYIKKNKLHPARAGYSLDRVLLHNPPGNLLRAPGLDIDHLVIKPACAANFAIRLL